MGSIPSRASPEAGRPLYLAALVIEPEGRRNTESSSWTSGGTGQIVDGNLARLAARGMPLAPASAHTHANRGERHDYT